VSKGISISADEVSVLETPGQFFERLVQNISEARDRIVLTSLYIGNGEKEKKIYHEIESFAARGGHVTIIIDWNRGQRGRRNSSLHRLWDIKDKYPQNFILKLFRSPLIDESRIVKEVPQLNETLSTQHTKIYLTDGKLILSGANLESAYFINRQDRYLEFTSPNLVEYFGKLANVISNYSYTVGNKEIDDFYQMKFDNIGSDLSALIESSSEISEADTIFCPHVQAGWANINWEQDMICQTVSQLTKSGSLYFCSGYFNPPLPLCAAIRDSQCSVNLLSADREANGFNKARWPKSGITPAYQMFADFMLKSIEDKEVKLSEWNRDKWTFHAKGMWFYENGNCVGSALGSSNFSFRSYAKDLETGGILLTQNKILQNSLNLERERIWAHAKSRSIQPVPKWVKLAAPKLRTFF